MALINLSTEWKYTLIGAALGSLGTYFIPKGVRRAAESIGTNIANKIRVAQNPGYEQSPSPELYNGIMGTLNRMDSTIANVVSRIENLETGYRKGG